MENKSDMKTKLFDHLREFDQKFLTPYDQPGVVYGCLETEVKNFNSANGTNFEPVSMVKEYLISLL